MTISCTLGLGDLLVRRRRWQALSPVERITTESGLRLVFPARPGVVEELAALASLERECCAFAAWTVEPEGDRVVLEVTARSEDAVARVQAMFR